MSMNALHAVLTLAVGLSFGVMWLRTFWNRPDRINGPILTAPVAVALLGLSHWVAYDFALGHWAGDFSMLQALFNLGVVTVLYSRRRQVRV